jgi:hypothetical protein
MFDKKIFAGTKFWYSVKGMYGFLYPSKEYSILSKDIFTKVKYFIGGNKKTAYETKAGVILWLENNNEN